MFLTPAELVTLTGGRRSDSQRRWLDSNGWVYTLNINGQPVVLRAYCERRLGGVPTAASAPGPRPNFDALRKAS